MELCVTFKLEFKADNVKKKRIFISINKNPPPMEKKNQKKREKRKAPNLHKMCFVVVFFPTGSCFQCQNYFHLMWSFMKSCGFGH